MYRHLMAYKYAKRKGHIIAPPSGRLPLHRLILWEKIGMGPHQCHYCGTGVNWSPNRTAEGCLIAEHMDGDHTNNDPSNIVPSCQTCNLIRGRDKRFENAHYVVRHGVRQLAEKRSCGSCGNDFDVLLKDLRAAKGKNANAGRYCSRECMYKGRSHA